MSNARWYDLAKDAGMEVITKRTVLPGGWTSVRFTLQLRGIEVETIVTHPSGVDHQSEQLNSAAHELLSHVYNLKP